MKYQSVRDHLPTGWAEGIKEKLSPKLRWMAQEAEKLELIPYTTRDGAFVCRELDWWTNGFWGAILWQMHLMTGDEAFRAAAIRAEELMDPALETYERLHHDVGFMWLIQSGVRHALEGNEESFRRTLFCAHFLASRFNPNGFIRAWNGEHQQGWAIIDCMMNLPLLYWASRQTGDPRFRLIAMRHADTAIRHFVREDGSCNHIVCFDPETGEFLSNPAGQGYASGSSWSRGQAWALYGFTLSHLMTGEVRYLDAAKKVAEYFLSALSEDLIPDCDFRQPKGETVKDNAAGAIAACGLMELNAIHPDDRYAQTAARLLLAMDGHCADWTLDNPAILTQCTEAWDHGRHITMNYADYFFIEAVNKLLGCRMLFWAPDGV